MAALPPTDLLSWWRAENNANDFIGGSSGTLVGGATFAGGEVAQAFRFDASMNGGVLVPASPSLNPTEAITIEAWVKPSSYPNNGSAILRKDANTGGTTQYSLNIGDGVTPGVAHFNIGGFAGVTGGAIPLNVWTHVAGTYDRHLLRLYVNGVEVASTPATQAIPTAATNLAIGKEELFTDRNFDGLIDEVSLYNRALSSSEIQSIAASSTEGKATVVVTTSADIANPSDGITSLREAIDFANAAPGRDVIGFNIPGSGVHTITPSTQLPPISSAVIIDGYTQPGASANTNGPGLADNAALQIEISGAIVTNNGNGMTIAPTASGSTVRGLVIDNSWSTGILVQAANTVIEGSYLGTDSSGLVARGNTQGVRFTLGSDTSFSRVGGTSASQRNVISANQIGVLVEGGLNHLIQGNFIGLDATGQHGLGSNVVDVDLRSTGALVGGTTPAERNVIAGANSGSGITVGTGTGNRIQGNFIGTNVTGTVGLGLTTAIRVDPGANSTRIGGATDTPGRGPGNIINASQTGFSSGEGIIISFNVSNCTIQGNLIGTDATGTHVIGFTHDAVQVFGPSTTIEGNVIAGSGIRGILVGNQNAPSHDVVIQGNFIGTDITGTLLLGNADDGVLVTDSTGDTISGNTIAGNAVDGVGITRTATGIALAGNSIFSNGRLGINLHDPIFDGGGVSPNDVGDGDTGGNRQQNFPVISRVTASALQATVEGTLNSTPNAPFRIELFASDAADPSGFGEGQFFLGATSVVTDGSGNAPFSAAVPGDWRGKVFAATATDLVTDDTSEYAQTIAAVTSDGDPLVVTSTLDTVGLDGVVTLREAINFANSHPGLDTISFQIPGSGVHTISPTSALPDITDAIVIDGYTQPGATPSTVPLALGSGGIGATGSNAVIFVELSGTSAGDANGLTLMAPGSTVRGLAINRFAGDGIFIGRSNTVVEGNFLGTDAAGTLDLGNGIENIQVTDFGGSDNNRIGGPSPASRNVLAGSMTVGIGVWFSSNNLIQGNLIGTDRTGTKALGNTGVVIVGGSGLPASHNNSIIGNLISGNSLAPGVSLDGDTSENLVQGNFIGTDWFGTAALGNGLSGVFIHGAADNTIGGTVPGEGNVIAFNGFSTVFDPNRGPGVLIQDFEGVPPTSIGNSILGNSIFANARLGIDLVGGTENAFGVTPNDSSDSDPGPNHLQNFPVISRVEASATQVNIEGSLTSTPNSPFRIEFFANDAADPSGFGQGQHFVGATSVVTDASGNATLSIILAGDVRGKSVTATATDLATGDTSEVSQGVAATRGPVTWDGNTDGDGDGFTWQDRHNWKDDQLPGAGDIVEIPQNAPTVELTDDAAIGTLILGGAGMTVLDLSGRTLTVAQTTTIASGGLLVLEGGTLASNVRVAAGGAIHSLTSAPSVGVIHGNVTSDGEVSPFLGLLRIEGNYAQNPTATLQINIDGPRRGADTGGFDALDVTGSAQLAGKLKLSSGGTFLPNLNDHFDVLTFASATGDFTQIDEPLIATDRHFAETKGATAVTLTVSPVATHAVVWDGNTDGDGDGVSWQDPHNWSTDRVPDLGDVAQISESHNTVELEDDVTVGRLVLGGAGGAVLDLAGHNLGIAQTTTITSSGILVLEGGTLLGDIDVAAGGAIHGLSAAPSIGIIHGDVTSDGEVSPFLGLLRVEGNYRQTPTGTLQVNIDGPQRGSDTDGFDALEVTGAAHLAGKLKISSGGTFAPNVADHFDVLTYASLVGDFSDFEDLELAGESRAYFPSAGTTAYRLTVNPYQAPQVAADIGGGEPGTTVDVNVLANDTGTGLTVQSFTPGANGSVTSPSPGVLRYTPQADFRGADTLSYTVRDQIGRTATASVTVFVGVTAWTGAGGDTDWNNPRNWIFDRLPTADSDVLIDLDHPPDQPLEVTLIGNPVSVHSLTTDETLHVTGTTLRIETESTIDVGGLLTLTNATLDGAGQLDNEGIVGLDSGTLSAPFRNQGTLTSVGASKITATLQTTVFSTIEIDSDELELDGVSLDARSTTIEFGLRDEHDRPQLSINGGVLQVDADTFHGQMHVLVQNGGFKVTGQVTLDGDALLGIQNATVDGTGSLVNKGRLELSDVTVSVGLRNEGILVSADGNSLDGQFANVHGATIQVFTAHGLPSTLTVPGGFTNEGQIELIAVEAENHPAPAATLAVSPGTLTNAAGGVIASTPADNAHGALVGTITNQGKLEIHDGLLLLDVGSTLNSQIGTIEFTGDDAQLQVKNSLLQVKGTSFPGPVDVLINHGRIDVTGDVTLAEGSSLDADHGSIEGTGRLINQGLIQLTEATSTAGLRNEAQLNVFGSTTISGALEAASASTLLINAIETTNATLTVAQGFTNEGQIILASENEVVDSQIVLQSGTLTNAPDATINVDAATGAIVGSVNNSGTLKIGNPTGRLSIVGDFSQTFFGRLQVDLGGTTPRTGHDQLVVSGASSLGGTLAVSLSNSFIPHTGDRFEVITSASFTGDFGTFEGLRPVTSIQLQPEVQAPAYVLTARTNQPPTANPDSATTFKGLPTLPIAILLNDSDVDRLPGDTLALDSFTQGTNGTVTLFAPGLLIYRPLGNFVGVDTFTYFVRDGGGLLSPGVVTVQVSGDSDGETESAVTSINDGLSAFGGEDGLLASWGSLFDLQSWAPDFAGFHLSPFDLSIVSQSLSTAFGLGGSSGSLAQISLPTINSTDAADGHVDTLPELVLALGHIPGMHLDAVRGGLNLPPLPTDLLQATFSTSLTNLLAQTEYNDSSTALEHLAQTVGLDGLLDWLGAIHVDLSFGVDNHGFYLRGGSGLTLDIQPQIFDPPHAPALSGLADIGQIADWNLHGDVLGDLNIALRPGLPEFRFRAGDLTTPESCLVPTASGGLTLDITSDRPGFHFDWNGNYGFTLSGLSVTPTFTATLDGHISLPGLTLPGANDPVTIDVVGTLNQTTWTLSLAANSPTDYSFSHFALTGVTATVQVSRDQFSGSFGGTISIPLCANHESIPLTFSSTFDTVSLHLHATALLADCYVGEPALLWLDHGTATLDIGVQFATLALTPHSGVSISADTAVVLPVETAAAAAHQASGPVTPPDGLATATQLEGSVDGAGNVHISFATLHADLGLIGTLDATNGSLNAGPDESGSPLVDVASATLRMSLLDKPVEVIVEGFKVLQTGDVTFTHAGLRGDDLFNTFSFGQIVRVKVNEIHVFGLPDPGTSPVRLDQFRLEVSGEVGFDALKFTGQTTIVPILQIGGLTVTTTTATVSPLDFDFDHGALKVNLDGPVDLSLNGFKFDPVTADLTLHLGEFVDGKYEFTDPGFDLNVTVDGNDTGASLDRVQSHGQIHFDTPNRGQTTLDLVLIFGFGFDAAKNPLAGLHIEHATATFDLGLTLGADLSFVESHVTLAQVTAQKVEVGIGDPKKRLVVLTANDLALDFADPAQPLASFTDAGSSVQISFPALAKLPGFHDLKVAAKNFEIEKNLAFTALPGFEIDLLDLPSPQAFGLPDWFPITLSAVGVQLGPGALNGSDVSDINILVSGGLVPVTDSSTPPQVIWPITATVDRLPISVQKLADGKLIDAIGIPPAGFKLGMEPFQIGKALEIGGSFALHSVVDPTNGESILYGQIEGDFKVAEIGGNISLVISQYGPIIAKIGIPLAVPLGPTGLILTGADGGMAFGPARFPVVDVPDNTSPDQVRQFVVDRLNEKTTFDPIDFSDDEIQKELLNLVRINEGRAGSPPTRRYTWDEGFTVGLAGHFTTIVSPGILTGDLNLAAEIARQPNGQLSVKFLGSGDAKAWGMELGTVGALLNLSDPLAPKYDLAFAVPAPDSTLSFLFPASAQWVTHLDTTGVVQAALIGGRTLVERLFDGTLDIGLDAIADSLAADRTRPLARLLNLDPNLPHDLTGDMSRPVAAVLNLNASVPITASELRSRLSTLFASSVSDLARLNLDDSAKVFSALLQEVFGAVNSLSSGQRTHLLSQLTALLGDATVGALQSAFDVFNPRLVMSGVIQPTILGIPFGDELLNADVSIDKRGVFVGFDASLHDMTAKLANLILPFGAGEFLFDLVSLGISDRLRYDLKLPLTGVFSSLEHTGKLPPTIDAMGNWVGGFTGEIRWLGFSLGQVSGYLFAPGSKTEVDDRTFLFDDSTTDFPDPVPPIDPATGDPTDTLKIPLSSAKALHDLETYGGLIGTSRFFVPALLADPVGLLAAMAAPTPEKPHGLFTLPDGDPGQDFSAYIHSVIDTITGVAAGLGASQEVGRMQLYLPTPPITGLLTADDWVKAAYLSGFTDMKLLSMPLARTQVSADASGLKLSADYPFLAGAHIDATIDFNNVNLNQAVEQLADSVGIHDLDVTNGNTRTITAPIPRVHLTAGLNTNRLARVLHDRLGLPTDLIFAAGHFDSQIQYFSPLYNFGNPDPMITGPERNGGVILDTHLSILNLIENEQFHFEASLFGEDIIPDYSASAHLSRGLKVPGLGFPDVQIVQQDIDTLLEKHGLDIKLGLSGTLGLLGLIQYNVSGTLGLGISGLFGDLTLGVNSGALANKFFNFDGSFSLQINTTSEPQTTVDAPPRQIPQGPYFGIHVAASADTPPKPATLNILKSGTGVSHFDLSGTFDLVIDEEGLTVDATASADIGINLSALGIPLPPLSLSGVVEAHLSLIDGRLSFDPTTDFSDVDRDQRQQIEGSIGIAPGDDGFQDGDFRLALTRWGFLQPEFYNADSEKFEPLSVAGVSIGLPLLDHAGDVHVYVDNQRKSENSGDTSIKVKLSRPTERDLRVNYTLTGGTADEGDDWSDGGRGFIIIRQNHESGSIPLTIVNDQIDEDNETLFVTIDPFYVQVDDDHPDGQPLTGLLDPKVAPAIFGDRDARFTIVDDDFGPPPVNIVIEAPPGLASVTLHEGTATVLATAITEGGSFSFTVRADNLDAQDSVKLAYHLVPLDPSLTTATLGGDFFAEASGQGSSGIVTLVGNAPRTINITTIQDTRYELNEQFEIQFEILQQASLADTNLSVDVARVTINNDDFDVPPGTLVFYDFDTLAPGGHPYVYDNRADHVDPRIWATAFEHRDDQSNGALLFDAGDQVVAPAGSPTVGLPTNRFSVDFWMNPGIITGQGTILALGGSPQALGEGLVIFLENVQIKYRMHNSAGQLFSGVIGTFTPGRWKHVALIYDGANIVGFLDGTKSPSTPASGSLDLRLAKFFLGSLPGGASSYLGFLDEFHLWSRALADVEVPVVKTSVAGNELGLILDYRFDEEIGDAVTDLTGHGWDGRLGTLFDSLNSIGQNPLADSPAIVGPTGRPDRVVVTNSPVSQLPRYIPSEEPNGIPKVPPVAPPSDPTSAITSHNWGTSDEPLETAPFYHFMIGVDAPRTAGRFDPSRMVAVHVDGIDFFERADRTGPKRWELRSSLDNFQEVIISGQTAPGEDYQHHVQLFADSVGFRQSFLHPTQPIEFRLYGLDATGGSWAIDNFALIAGLVPVPSFDLPPIAPPQTVTAVGGSTPPFSPTSNATDPNGDPIAISDIVVPAGAGTLTRDASGQYSFAPAAGVTGNVPIKFTLLDRWGLTATSTVTVNIQVGAADDAFTINEDTTLNANVLTNDLLPAGQVGTISLVGAAPAATQFVLSANGSLTFRPIANASGTLSFTYHAAAQNFSDDATVTINITPQPDAPLANTDRYRIISGATLNVARPGVLANDTDPDGDPLTVSLVSSTSSGTLSLAADGSFTYRPNANFAGSDGFTYLARDPSGRTSQGSVIIGVIALNRPPFGTNDTASVPEDGSLTLSAVTLLSNDGDPEGGPVIVTAVGTPAHGTLTTVASGSGGFASVTYHPAANYFGPDSFSYTIADSSGLTATAIVNLTVTPVNDPPTGQPDLFQLDLRTATNRTLTVAAPRILANDADIEGSALTAVLDTRPTHGTLTSFNASGAFVYVSNGSLGTDSFTYRAVDASGAQSAPIPVRISVFISLPPTPLPPPPTTPPPTGGGGTTGGTIIHAVTSKGYVADGSVFFDANLNGVRDFLDLNGNGIFDAADLDEPAAVTDGSGAMTLVISNAFDTDGSGFFEPAEGVLVSIGGIVSGTTQPLVFPLRATLGAQVITPLTSLVTSLVLDAGMTAAAAQTRVLDGLGLPAFELLGLDPIAETVAGNSVASNVLMAHSAVASAYLEISSLLAGASARSNSTIGLAVVTAMVAELVPVGSHLDLSNAAQVARIVQSAASRLGISLTTDTIPATAAAVVAANSAFHAVPRTTGIDFVQALTRVESATQGAVANDLAALGAGRTTPAAIISQTTGTALETLIASAPVGPVLPLTGPHLLTNLYATPAVEGGSTTLFGSIAVITAASTRLLLINWGDGAVEQLNLASGATSFRIDHEYADDAPLGTPADDIPIGVVLLVNAQAVDAASVSVNVANAAPQFDDLTVTPVTVAGGLASATATVSDIGLLDALTLSVNWGDGYTELVPIAATGQEIDVSHLYASPGHYNVVLTATDDDGGTLAQTRSIDVIPPTPPAIQSIQIGDGTAQRSMVSNVIVVFNQPVTWDTSAAVLAGPLGRLHRIGTRHPIFTRAQIGGPTYIVAADNSSHDGRTYIVSFIGPNLIGGSLPDGRYKLLIPTGSVNSSTGVPMFADASIPFNRLFGDADGDGDVDRLDKKQFMKSVGAMQFQANYRPFFDYDASGRIDQADKTAFFSRFNLSILNLPPEIHAASSSIVVNEGSTAANHGTFSDLDSQNVIVSASLGTIVQQNGSWTWSYPTSDDFTTPVVITATDSDGAVSTVCFSLNVKNVAPSIADARMQVAENAPRGTSVGFITAADPGPDTLTYSITGGSGATAFAINRITGQITVADPSQLDYETTRSLKLNVKVTDGDAGSDTANITIDLVNRPSIQGAVFVDKNKNGKLDAKESGIDGVILELLDELGAPVLNSSGAPMTTATANGGLYVFGDLMPGTYRVRERQPSGYRDGPDLPGSLGGTVFDNDTLQLSLVQTEAHDYFFTELTSQ